jgi:glycosyltransferase involved in cell wall biosynthesis
VTAPNDLLVAVTMMPRTGDTGVQTHVNAILDLAPTWGRDTRFVSPWEGPRTVRRAIRVFARVSARFLTSEVGAVISRRGFRLLMSGRVFRAVWRHASRGRDVVVYVQDPNSARAALPVKRVWRGIRIVMCAHFNVSEHEEWVNRGRAQKSGSLAQLLRRDEQAALRGVDLTIFPSRFSHDAVVGRAGEPLAAVVTPHFVSPPEGGTSPIGSVSGDLITIGTLEPRKNHAYLLRVLARLHASGLPSTMTIVGDGESKVALQRLAADLGLTASVRFVGRVVPAADLIAEHRVYVHSAHMESFGLVLVEALARGRPVCAPPVGGMPEIIRDGKEGILWPLDDEPVAAQRLLRLLTDEDYYRSLAAQASVRYRNCYAPWVLIDRWRTAICGG